MQKHKGGPEHGAPSANRRSPCAGAAGLIMISLCNHLTQKEKEKRIRPRQ